MRGKAYTCSDCGEPVSGGEIARATASERAALREGKYMCAACRQRRQISSL